MSLTNLKIKENFDYLLEIKNNIKNAIIAKGVPVADNDTFYSYAEKIMLISGGIQVTGYSINKISSNWQFSNTDSAYTNIDLPYCVNALDGVTTNMYRGKAYFKKSINTISFINSLSDIPNTKFILYFGSVNQYAEIYINSTLVKSVINPYQEFFVDITDYIPADGSAFEVKVISDNTKNVDVNPYEMDYNPNNGIDRDVYLILTNTACFDINEYGCSKAFITPSVANKNINIKTRIQNYGQIVKNLRVEVVITEPMTKNILSQTYKISVEPNSFNDINENIDIVNPKLWDGLNNANVYNIIIYLKEAANVLDKIEANVGFRTFELLKPTVAENTAAFKLNNVDYSLYGFNYHTDIADKGSALSRVDYEIDWANMWELRPTMIKFAHYNVDQYLVDQCDKNGIIACIEIPWTRNAPVSPTTVFKDQIFTMMKQMIKSYYNHPSVIFYSMSNEVGYEATIGYTDAAAHSLHKELYEMAKQLDPTRVYGISNNNQVQQCLNWTDSYDYVQLMNYAGWYGGYGTVSTCVSTTKGFYNKSNKPLGIGEHGAGANTAQHTNTPAVLEGTSNIGSNGTYHPEEYQSYVHENYNESHYNSNWLLHNLIWVMNDFAVSSRKEGGQVGLNNKGLITRNRGIKKDSFYYYKSLWNHDDPFIYLTEKRNNDKAVTVNGPSATINLKAYSNLVSAESLPIYSDSNKLNLIGYANVANPLTYHNIYTADVLVNPGENNFYIAHNDLTDTYYFNYITNIEFPSESIVSAFYTQINGITQPAKSSNVTGTYDISDDTLTLAGTPQYNDAAIILQYFLTNGLANRAIYLVPAHEGGTITFGLEMISGDLTYQFPNKEQDFLNFGLLDIKSNRSNYSFIQMNKTNTSMVKNVENTSGCIGIWAYACGSTSAPFDNFKFKTYVDWTPPVIYDGGILEPNYIKPCTANTELYNIISRFKSGTFTIPLSKITQNMFIRLSETIIVSTTNTKLASKTVLIEQNRPVRLTLIVTDVCTGTNNGTTSEWKIGFRDTTNANLAPMFDLLANSGNQTFDTTFAKNVGVIYMYKKDTTIDGEINGQYTFLVKAEYLD